MTQSHLLLRDTERSNLRSLRFGSAVSCKGAEVCHVLLLNINRKAYNGSSLECLPLILVTLKGQCQDHSNF